MIDLFMGIYVHNFVNLTGWIYIYIYICIYIYIYTCSCSNEVHTAKLYEKSQHRELVLVNSTHIKDTEVEYFENRDFLGVESF